MIRSWRRNIAKNRMRDMGYDHINKRMGTDNGRKINKKIYKKINRTRQGRAKLDKMRNDIVPIWRRVLEGNLLNKALTAQDKANRARKAARENRN